MNPGQRGRKKTIENGIKEKLDKFLSRNNISFTFPGRNNQIYVGKGDDGERQYKTEIFALDFLRASWSSKGRGR